MTHSPHHSQPPARSHRIAFLPDEAATARFGEKLAACIVPGLRIYLRGELGSGKTTLIRGLLRALGVRGSVRSPSYTLVEPYVVSRLHLYHFDFYRFMESNEFEDSGLADYFRGDGVCLVEWPERAGATLPRADLEISLSYAGTGREFTLSGHGETGKQCIAKFPDV